MRWGDTETWRIRVLVTHSRVSLSHVSVSSCLLVSCLRVSVSPYHYGRAYAQKLWYHNVSRRHVKGAIVTLLLLIRHGANDWVHGRLAGWTPGVHLNDDGRSQAAATAARLATLPIDAIYTSPLDRTVETAQAIAGPRGMPLRLVEGLGEVKYGEWQGAELKELYKHELW